ncbi:MAG: hypothetical protein E6973_16250, partial [Enterobacter hormaechei]
VSCSWRVLVRVLLGPTACERGTAIFLFIGFEPYFTRCFYLAQVIRFSPLTLPPKLKNLNIV